MVGKLRFHELCGAAGKKGKTKCSRKQEDEIKQDEKKLIFYMLSISVLSSMIVHLSDLITLYMRTVVLEKTLKGPLDCKEIKPVQPKGSQS